MRILLSFLLLSAGFAYSQQMTIWSASKSSGINSIAFDNEGNRYIYGYYKGSAQFSAQLPVAQKNQYYFAKVNPHNIVEWTVPASPDRSRFEIMVKNNEIICVGWHRDSDYTNDKHERALYLEKYSLDGRQLMNKELAFVTDKEIALTSHLTDYGIILQATFKTDERNSFVLGGKDYNKKKYSTVVLWNLDFDGTKRWEYQIEGGFNGFTDIRIGDIEMDAAGNTYIGSYYSESAELGFASLTTQKRFDGPIDLYDHGTFLMKIDPSGKGVMAKKIADFAFDLEKLLVDQDQNIYVSAFYKGSDAYEKAQGNGGNHMAPLLFGQPLPDTESIMGDPSEDHVLAKIDIDFNLVWRQITQSKGYARSNSMELHDGMIYLVGTSSRSTKVGDIALNLTNEGYSDIFYATYQTTDGKVTSAKGFTGENSNIGQVYVSPSGEVLISGSFRNPIAVDGVEYPQVGSVTTAFIYSAKGGSSNQNQTTNSNANQDNQPLISPGARVKGNWKGQGTYYLGTVEKLNIQEHPNLYFVKYDDGDTEWTTRDKLILVRGATAPTSNGTSSFNVGDRVQGNWKGQGKYYPGKIAKIAGGRYYIEYDDGDVEWTTADKLKRP